MLQCCHAEVKAGPRVVFSRTVLFSNSRFSPMMNRFFPANFPNKQYQLLFTQGSGESKEGTPACQSVSVSCSLVSTCSPLKQPHRLASCSLLCLVCPTVSRASSARTCASSYTGWHSLCWLPLAGREVLETVLQRGADVKCTAF